MQRANRIRAYLSELCRYGLKIIRLSVTRIGILRSSSCGFNRQAQYCVSQSALTQYCDAIEVSNAKIIESLQLKYLALLDDLDKIGRSITENQQSGKLILNNS